MVLFEGATAVVIRTEYSLVDYNVPITITSSKERRERQSRGRAAECYRRAVINNQSSVNTDDERLWRNLDFLRPPNPKGKSAVLTRAMSKRSRVEMKKKHKSIMMMAGRERLEERKSRQQ